MYAQHVVHRYAAAHKRTHLSPPTTSPHHTTPHHTTPHHITPRFLRLADILLDATAVEDALSNLLVKAVGEDSPNRTLYISSILKMEKAVQKSLMRVIEAGERDVTVDLVWEVGGVITPRKGAGGGSRGSGTPIGERELEQLVADLKADKELLARHLAEQKAVNDDLSQEVRNRILRAERGAHPGTSFSLFAFAPLPLPLPSSRRPRRRGTRPRCRWTSLPWRSTRMRKGSSRSRWSC